MSDWSLWCALNQNCIGVKSKLGETLLGEDPLYVLCIYLLYEINITTLISIPYCSVAEGSYPFHPQKFHPRAFILSFSPLHFILTNSSLLFHLAIFIFTNSSPPFYPYYFILIKSFFGFHLFDLILYIQDSIWHLTFTFYDFILTITSLITGPFHPYHFILTISSYF